MKKNNKTAASPAAPLTEKDRLILEEAVATRKTAHDFAQKEQYTDALERIIAALKGLRDFSDYERREFKELMVVLLFDLAEVHFNLKDYKQSEKELETLFKVLDGLLKLDAERFGHLHILAMELSTRILRSRRKVMDMLVKQKINAEQLYEKVNQGVVAATDKLVESLRKVGQLLAAAGDYREALKFYAEAVKFSKKRTGKMSRKEVKLSIEMAEVMMRVRQLRPRARRLLAALLKHAIALETVELEEEILTLTEMVENQIENEPRWKQFFLLVAGKGGKKKDAEKK
ncbi:MAG: hypothetical protein J1E97_05755 [Muribaculaceae bacterium]|nr:hypothetical protein [Muribaculaceae bacterium]